MIKEKNIVSKIHSLLDEKKADHIVEIDLRPYQTFCDYFIIASGTSSRHVAGMSDAVLSFLKEEEGILTHAEGAPQCEWVVIDGGDVVVHLFKPEKRLFYNLEKMYGALPHEASILIGEEH